MRTVVINDAYRTSMESDALVHKDDLNSDLIGFTKVLSRYIQDGDSVVRQFKEARNRYEEKLKERYEYYRWKTEFVASERDADKLAKGDAETIVLKNEMERLEADFNLINDQKELLKQKYWAIKSLIDLIKFQSGE